jgi:hypothetical protein
MGIKYNPNKALNKHRRACLSHARWLQVTARLQIDMGRLPCSNSASWMVPLSAKECGVVRPALAVSIDNHLFEAETVSPTVRERSDQQHKQSSQLDLN